MMRRLTVAFALVVPGMVGPTAPTLHAQVPGVSTQTIDVDGISTRYHTADLETRQAGQAVVVLQSGAGGTPIEAWAGVLAGLEGRAAVLAYERPGIGGTSAPDEPLTVALVNGHLEDLLEALEIAPPYILVGHSWGGALILDYGVRHPDDVAGSIYVDPITFLNTQEDFRALLGGFAASEEEADDLWTEHKAMGEREQQAMEDRMPPGVVAELELITTYMEGESGRDAVPPEHPITVLLGFRPMPGPPPPFPEAVDPMEFFRRERELARSKFEAWLENHPNATVRVLPETSHLVPREAPEAIVEAIERLLQALREEAGPGSEGAAHRAG